MPLEISKKNTTLNNKGTVRSSILLMLSISYEIFKLLSIANVCMTIKYILFLIIFH